MSLFAALPNRDTAAATAQKISVFIRQATAHKPP